MNFGRVYIRIVSKVSGVNTWQDPTDGEMGSQSGFVGFVKNTNNAKKQSVKNKNGGEKMSDLSNTQFFQVEPGPQISAKDILEIVFKALKEKGYNPINQIVGYLLSGDPAYIPRYQDARNLIRRYERDELLEVLIRDYLKNHGVVL